MGQDATAAPSDEVIAVSTPAPDFNRDIYYRNKLEFSLETGGFSYQYSICLRRLRRRRLLAKASSLHLGSYLSFASLAHGRHKGSRDSAREDGSYGHHLCYCDSKGTGEDLRTFDLGVRRNFVHRNWRTAPYFEFRLGAGLIDAKEPEGVSYAQGQDFTFTLMMGAGARYNFNPRYSMSFGPEYTHVSNLYLSEQHVCPTVGYLHPCYNNGINVWGGMVGFNVRLGKAKQGR